MVKRGRLRKDEKRVRREKLYEYNSFNATQYLSHEDTMRLSFESMIELLVRFTRVEEQRTARGIGNQKLRMNMRILLIHIFMKVGHSQSDARSLATTLLERDGTV